MSVARWLLDELDAVIPRRDSAPRDLPRVELEDDTQEVPPPPLRLQFGRRGEVTMRDRVLAMVREHGPMGQREIFIRALRAAPDANHNTVRGCVGKELRILEEHGVVRRCRTPRDVDQRQVWWEVVS